MQTRKQKAKASALSTLLAATRPGARLLVVSGTAFLLNGKEHRHIQERAFSALIDAGWITQPRQIESTIAESTVTTAGYCIAQSLEAQKRAYKQLEFCFGQAEPSYRQAM